MQGNHPIAFESRKLRDYEKLYSIYDKEMLAIMHALAKFRHYLVGNRFKVKNRSQQPLILPGTKRIK